MTIFCKIVNIFATRMKNNGEETILIRELKGDITEYLKTELNSYITCAMTIFFHDHFDVFPQIFNIFHFITFTVTKQAKVRTAVSAHY